MPFVPVVDLTDPEREPSDEELEALMRSVREKVVEGNRRTRERFLANLKDSIARAAQGGTGSAPDRPHRSIPEECQMTLQGLSGVCSCQAQHDAILVVK